MTIFRSLAEIPSSFGPCVLTIGNFDGIHIGHQHIMRRVLEIARKDGLASAVLTFDPHPAHILAPERPKRRIMTTPLRLERLAALGLDAVCVFPFSVEFAKLTPEEFADTVLVKALHTRRVLVGRDFRFGYQQTGDIDTLRRLGMSRGFEVEPVEAVLLRGERVSSTVIRNHLEAGEVSRACRMLGSPFVLLGRVVRGHGIGSKQTVPTLNLETENEVLPRAGVYVTRTRELAPLESGQEPRRWRSITNVGYRPTFDGEALTIETFLLDPLAGETPHEIAVEFLRWVREERRFDNAEALKSQIFRDVSVANRLHGRLARLRMK